MNWAWFSLALAVFTFPAHLLLGSQIPETRLAHSGLSSEFISLKYALAAEVATVLNLSASDSNAATGIQITESPQLVFRQAALAHEVGGLGPYRIITDEGSNSLLVSASPSDLVKIKGIIAKLDV